MYTITYLETSGAANPVRVAAGKSLMRGAVDNGVPGIDGDCGGAAAGATCHIYVPESWNARIASPTAQELEMLACADDVNAQSRLACQISMTPELDGIEVRLPVTKR